MKTFSKRLLTMILAAAMVFSLSGMTLFAAEADDSATREDAADAEALSAGDVQVLAGTEPELVDGYYEITSAENLEWLADQVASGSNKSINAKVTKDIDASELGTAVRIGTSNSSAYQYTGTFDGQGHTITVDIEGDTSSSSGNYMGLFGYIGNGGVVENLTVAGTVIGYMYVGLLAGYTNSGSTIKNCTTGTEAGESSVYSGYEYGGGISGNDAGGTFEDCTNFADVTVKGSGTTGYGGGIAPRMQGTMTNCCNYGKIEGESTAARYISGIGSNTGGTMTNCVNYGEVIGLTNYVGGVSAYTASGNTVTFTNCGNEGNVTSYGNTARTSYNCWVGGVVGDFRGSTLTVKNCYNTGDITGSYGVGGIVGNINAGSATVDTCYNTGDITQSSGKNSQLSGGVIGESAVSMSVSNAFNMGTVTDTAGGSTYVGSLVGAGTAGSIAITVNTGQYLEGTAEAAYATGALGADYTNLNNVESETLETMRSQDFVDLLNETTDGAYKKGCEHPLFTWQPDATHTWGEDVTFDWDADFNWATAFRSCTVDYCGAVETADAEITSEADGNQIKYTATVHFPDDPEDVVYTDVVYGSAGANMGALRAEYEEDILLIKEVYTDDSWAPFAEALDAAAAILEKDNTEVTQTQVDEALAALQSAKGELEKAPYTAISVIHNEEVLGTISVEDYQAVQAKTGYSDLSYTSAADPSEEVSATERFIKVKDLLSDVFDGDSTYLPDGDCGVIMGGVAFPSMDNAYIFYQTSTENYRGAQDGAAEEAWPEGVTDITLGHVYENAKCIICGADQPLPTVTDMKITSDAEDDIKTVDGTGIELTVSATVDPLYRTEVTYQWYKVIDGVDEELPGANDVTYTTGPEVSDSGTYKCILTAKNDAGSTIVEAEITVAIEEEAPPAFAIYSADDGLLAFYTDENVPAAGSSYDGHTVTDVYENVDTLNLTTSNSVPWYSYRSAVTSVVVDESFSKAKPISLAWWFYEFSNAKFTGLENINTLKVTSLRYTFYKCSAETAMDLNSWDTRHVTCFFFTFSGCSGLTSLGVSDWNTSSAAGTYGAGDGMRCMFANCSKLTRLDLSGWDTSGEGDFYEMFYGCSSLASLDVSTWDTSNVTCMFEVFYGCTNLESLDLSHWDPSSVTTFSGMFNGCTSLTTIGDVSQWDTSNATNMSSMFNNCSGLASVDLSGWNTSKVTTMSAMFSGCQSLTNVEGVSGWSTSNVTSFSTMFANTKLTSLDLYRWNFSSATNVSYMFRNCGELTDLGDVSSWNLSSATSASYMFQNCYNLTSLDASGWTTSKLQNISYMFQNCYSLTDLNVSGWTTTSVTDVRYMFDHCTSLKLLDLNSWRTTSLTSNSAGFATNCDALEGIRYASNNVSIFSLGQAVVSQQNWYYSYDGGLASTDYLQTIDEDHLTSLARYYYCGAEVSSLQITSDADDNSKVYDGEGIELTVSGMIYPLDDATYQWYKVVDGVDQLIEEATEATYTTGANPSASGTYKCVVTATNQSALEAGLSSIPAATGEAQITVTIEAGVDKDLLKAAIDAAEALLDTEDNYTPESWQVFTDALDDAWDVYINSDSEEEVRQATLDLMSAISNLESVTEGEEVDKTELLDLYAQASQLDAEDYTEESWAPFAEALARAEEVLLDPKATEERVEAATDELDSAMRGLAALVDTSALEAAIEAANDLDSDDYTPNSWEALGEVLKTAEGVLADPTSDQDDIDEATEALETAIGNLVERADKDVLESTMDAAAELLSGNSDDYTESSWNALVEAYEAAGRVFDDPNATQEEVNKAAINLVTAIVGLASEEPTVSTADKSGLLEAFAEAVQLDEEDYTADTWAVLEEALKTAQKVLVDAYATEQDVSDATTALENAMKALEPVPAAVDKSALEAAIAEANDLDGNAYTPDSWEALEEVLGTAEDVLADVDASQEEVDAAAKALESAIKDLVERADKDVLKSAMDTAEEILQDDDNGYTEDSLKALQEALEAAGDVYGDNNASQKEVDDAAIDLVGAIAGLESAYGTAADKEDLLAAYVAAMELNAEDYTEESWKAVADALDTAQEVLLDTNATDTAVEDATKALTKAMEDLVKVVDKSALEAAIAAAADLKASDYTPDSWSALETALGNAQAIAASPDATQDAVDSAAAVLTNAIDSLQERADTAVLVKAIEAGEALLGDEDKYTDTTWEAFVKAYDAAIALDYNATQDEVNKATIDLMEAIINLAPVDASTFPSADKGDLFAAYTEALQLNASDYTEDSWDAVADAIATAENLLLNAEAPQNAVDAATDALKKAMEALAIVVDMSALESAIGEAEALLAGNADAYTPVSWDALRKAFETAEEAALNLAGSDAATNQGAVDTAAEALREAIGNLVKRADTTVLSEEIKTAKALLDAGNDNYTDESWEALQKAYEAATALDDNATQDDVNNAAIDLMEAILGLTSKAVTGGETEKSALFKAYTEALQMNAENYTVDSWKAVADALATAEDLLLNAEASQTDVDAATTALTDAMEALEKVVDMSALDTAIAAAQALTDTDYTEDSWKDLEAALDAAEAARKLAGTDAKTNQSTVDDAAEVLNSAIGALQKRADTTVLDAAIETAGELLAGEESDYTPESWKALQDAYDAATSLDAANASQDEVNGVTVDLMNAIVGLTHEVPEVTVNKTELLAAYTEALQLDEADYTAESWDALVAAVTDAAAVLLNEDATQGEVDDATDVLMNAMADLKPALDKSALNAAIEKAESLTESDYTPESWAALTSVLAEAVDVAADDYASQEEINAAAAALTGALDALVKKGDKAALEAAIESAEALAADKDNYTQDSWNALEEALATAVTVDADVNAAQDAVNTATVDLVAAIAGLTPTDSTVVTVDKSELLTAYTGAMRLDEADYTPQSWEAVADALTAAQALLVDQDASKEDVDAATQAITDAVGALVPAVDKSALEAAINAAKALDEDDYTPNSWAAVESALATAQALADSDTDDQGAVDAAAAALTSAIDALVKKADKAVLETALASAENLLGGDKDSYTEDSWNDLTAAYETAKDVYGDDNVSQAAVDDATVELVSAIANLTPEEPTVEETNKSDLLAAYADAMKLNEADYTSKSWGDLETALGDAQKVLLDDTATQDAINDATDALTTAMENLKPAVDMSALDAAIEKAEALTETDYTPNSWEVLEAALGEAQDIAQSGDATQDVVDAAADALNAAIDALVEKADKTVLNGAIEAAKNLIETDYTSETWKTLTAALEEAQKVAADPNVTQSDVNDATVELVTAITDLELVTQPGGQGSDTTTLLTEYVQAMELSENDYTADSWEPFVKARAEAQRVLTDPDATEDEVEAAAVALQAAMENLVKKTGNTGTPKNGLCRIESGVRWGYYVNDKVDTSFTGFVTNKNGDWYVRNGYVIFADPSESGVFKDKAGAIGEKGTWYYVVRGKVQHDFTGLANYKNENGWWYIKNGVVDFTHNGVDKNKNGWWYVVRGKVRFNFTGLAHYRNANGWWYIRKGKVDFTHNGVDKNQNGWWYVTGGKVQFGFTGLANYRNQYGWWYIAGGKVLFNYTGIASNRNGTWYVRDSKVRFDYNGTVRAGGTTYTVRNGKVY